MTARRCRTRLASRCQDKELVLLKSIRGSEPGNPDSARDPWELSSPSYDGRFDFAIDQYWDNKGQPAKIAAQIKASPFLRSEAAPTQQMKAVDKEELVYVLQAWALNLLADGEVARQIDYAINAEDEAKKEVGLDYVKGLYSQLRRPNPATGDEKCTLRDSRSIASVTTGRPPRATKEAKRVTSEDSAPM